MVAHTGHIYNNVEVTRKSEQFPLKCKNRSGNNYIRSHGSVGRAHRSHRWGHRFESCCDHSQTLVSTTFARVFSFYYYQEFIGVAQLTPTHRSHRLSRTFGVSTTSQNRGVQCVDEQFVRQRRTTTLCGFFAGILLHFGLCWGNRIEFLVVASLVDSCITEWRNWGSKG